MFDQMMADGMNDAACVRDVNRRGWPIDEIWVDIAGGATQSFEGASTLTALRDLKRRTNQGIRCITGANREIAYGVDKTRVLLGGDGYPHRIKFAKRLVTLEVGKPRGIIKDIAAYRYPEVKDGKAITDVPLKDGVHDHANDCLRYFAVGRWLCVPKLRKLDPSLSRNESAGWKVAA